MTRRFGGHTRRWLVGGTIGAALQAALPSGRIARVGALVPADDDVVAALDRLSLPEKAAQLLMIPAEGTTMTAGFRQRLAAERPGGVILVGANFGSPAEVREFVAAIRATNPEIAPLVALDQEGGPVSRLPDDPAPGAVALGRLPDLEVRDLARARAELIADYGFDINFAPVADVAYDPASSMADRAFGADPAFVATKVRTVVSGVTGTGVHHTVKHFPGHGRATLDSHDALPTIDLSREEWRASDALPFRAAVEAGVELVMLGHLRYPRWDEAPASLSAVAVEVLRSELGFAGVVVSDDLGMAALAAIDPLAVVDRAIAAGVDLLLYVILPVPSRELIAHIVGRVETGAIPVERIDASVGRLLRLRAAGAAAKG